MHPKKRCYIEAGELLRCKIGCLVQPNRVDAPRLAPNDSRGRDDNAGRQNHIGKAEARTRHQIRHVSFGDVWRRCGPEEDMDGPPQGSQVQVPGGRREVAPRWRPVLGLRGAGPDWVDQLWSLN